MRLLVHNCVHEIFVNFFVFLYDPISENEVYSQILQLNPLKAAGPENVPIKLLKILAPIISTYLRDAFNKCHETGIFPNSLKNAKIVPIYKAKQKDRASNYRPISLLSPISKIFEKLLYSRLELFFSKNKVITKQQFGFRCGYSTEMAVTDLYNQLIKNRDDGYNSCCLFLDLSKAFDTVNHKLLLDKLYLYGIRGNMHNLLSSYLTNRQQFTICNNIPSKASTIVCGVPQGSTLGPLLFSLYINDLPLHTNFQVNMFADDTVLTLKNKNTAHLQQQVNQELTSIDEWMKYNRLSLNYTKTTYFVCAPKCHSSSWKNFTIKIGKHIIPSVESIKYLGVMIDKHLNWKAHIDYVIKKLSYAARILSIIRHYVNKQTLIKLYYSFAYPYLKYGIISWGSACQTSLAKIQVLQNNIIRIMNFKFVKDKAKMCTLFKSMKILKVKDIFELEIAKFMYSYYHSMLPENFDNYFKYASKHHDYKTRSIAANNFYLERAKTRNGQRSCSYIGVKIWNKISPTFKQLPKYSFSKQIKLSMLSNY